MLSETLGHEIGYTVGLSHPWETEADGIIIDGTVPPITDTAKFPDLDFVDRTDLDLILVTEGDGWIGLYAYDNRFPPQEAIIDRLAVFNTWIEQENLAKAARKAILDAHDAAVADGTATQTQAQAEAAAETAYKKYTNKLAYKRAIQKRNLYWARSTPNQPFKLRCHTYNRSASGLDPNGAGPYTYTYGNSIMDYGYVIRAADEDTIEGIYVSQHFPAFHNWEYDLGVPQDRTQPGWSSRPNPKPIPCDGQVVVQPVQTITSPPPNDGSSQNTQPPDTPTDLNASSENGQVRLSWTAPSGTVTDYEYRYRESGGSWGDNWISMISSDPDVLTDTEFFVLSLINGTTYEFQLRAVNGEIASAATESSESTPATVPGKPTRLVGDRYNQGVTLRWYPPDDDGGADVTEYQYRYSYTYETYRSWTTIRGLNNGPNSGPKRSVSIGGLTNGRQYQFQVRAKNSAGYGTESLTIYKTPATTPGAPQNLNAPTGDGEVSLEWDAPSSNGGFKITEYKYSYRESSSDSWDTEGSAGTEQEKTITGLTNSTEYEFRVRAKNSLGLGPWSDTINATPQPPPVWSDIPDPYNLTVGDSFSLDLSSYVTGNPTITWTSGWKPVGLSFSNGVLSGTVTTVESRSIQFTATNSAGSAKSEWVQIVVQAAE